MRLQLLKVCSLLCLSLSLLACDGGGGGGGGLGDLGDPVNIDPTSVITIDMTTDKVNLNTSAEDSAEITITTRDGNNGALGNIDVDLSSTAGILSPSLVTTNASGTATLTFSAGPEKSNQVAVITASSGISSKDLPITISGTTLTLNSAKNSLLAGVDDSTILTAVAKDSNSVPVSSAAITLTSAIGNLLTADGATGTSVTVTTGANGTATATLTALDTVGADTITASGLGTQAEVTVNVTNAQFVFTAPEENTTIPVGTDTSLTVTWKDVDGNPINGQLVTFTTTGGYFDNVIGKTSTTVLTDVAGEATVMNYTASDVATPADITATTGIESDTLRLLVAATDPNQLSLQASPSVLRPSIGDVSSSSTITAIVRNLNGQLVSGQTVVFSLVDGPGGGESISPGTAITDASGTAEVAFVSGSATSAKDGVIIRAVVQSAPTIYAETRLTIGNTATSIVIGTTNVISEEFAGDPPLAVGYALPFSILVTDINGNPIPSATVDLGAYPLFFYTGYELDPTDSGGVEFPPSGSGEFTGKEDGSDPIRSGKFDNEDVNRNGFLDIGEDGAIGTYGGVDAIWYRGAEGTIADTTSGVPNGRLDPGGVVSIPKTVVTDANGLAAFELKYAKGFGNWVDIEISASTQVFGDLSSAKTVVPLKVLLLDVPYPNSPFGL